MLVHLKLLRASRKVHHRRIVKSERLMPYNSRLEIVAGSSEQNLLLLDLLLWWHLLFFGVRTSENEDEAGWFCEGFVGGS